MSLRVHCREFTAETTHLLDFSTQDVEDIANTGMLKATNMAIYGVKGSATSFAPVFCASTRVARFAISIFVH